MENRVKCIITPASRARLLDAIKAEPARSAWARGVKLYALELVEGVDDGQTVTREALLNGASSWSEYSKGGCSLILDGDIARRLCTPSEYKRKRGGELEPGGRESWLDVQARALCHAGRMVCRLAREVSA